MKKKALLAVLSASAVAVTGLAAIGTSTGIRLIADNTDQWHHYAAREATASKRGTYEYWINCNQSAADRIVFEAPVSGNIVEATAEEVAALDFEDVNDERWSSETLSGNQDVFLNKWKYVAGTGWGMVAESSFSINLGAYASYTLTSLKAGEISLGTNASSLDVSGFAADHSQDGMYDVEAKLTKNGRAYTVYAPTTFITSDIAGSNPAESLRQILDFTSPKSDVYGYYVYTKDMLPSGTADWHWNAAAYNSGAGCSDSGSFGGFQGFHATIDGRGHKIGLVSNSLGILTASKGGAIKDIEIVDYGYSGAAGKSLLGNYIRETKFENVTFTLNDSSAGDTDVETTSRYGWLSSYGFVGCSFKNVMFNAEGKRIYTLFGTANGGAFGTNTFTGCTFKAKSYQALTTHGANIVVQQATGLTIIKG